MSTISGIISDLKFGRSMLLKSIEGLSYIEKTEISIYDEWTIKDIFAHVIGWDERVIKILPLMLQDRASEVGEIEVDKHNRQSVAAWQDESLAQVMAKIQSTHQQILDILLAMDHKEIDKRHDRKGRIITIRGYVIEIMLEHERQHALEIKEWRQTVDNRFIPKQVRADTLKNRAEFMTILDCFVEADILDKSAVGVWSISDLVGHVADWEQTVLQGVKHIYDPSQPIAPQLAKTINDWNDIMVTNRADKSWAENYHYLRQSQQQLDDFIAGLTPGDWKLRGPYPWGDYGSLAELLMVNAGHYADHTSDLETWYRKQYNES